MFNKIKESLNNVSSKPKLLFFSFLILKSQRLITIKCKDLADFSDPNNILDSKYKEYNKNLSEGSHILGNWQIDKF